MTAVTSALGQRTASFSASSSRSGTIGRSAAAPREPARSPTPTAIANTLANQVTVRMARPPTTRCYVIVVSTLSELTRGLRSRVHPVLGTVKVTFLNSQTDRRRCGYTWNHGEAIWPALSRREVARSGGRAMDAADRARPSARARAIPGPARTALRHPAEVAGRPPTTDGASGAGGPRVLLETPAARHVRAHRPRA